MSEWVCTPCYRGGPTKLSDVGKNYDNIYFVDKDDDSQEIFNNPALNLIFRNYTQNSTNECLFCKKFANCHTDGHRCAAYEPR